MSAFTFIHAADLHLGSPLASLATRNRDLAERFMAAGREAFMALIEQAIAMRAAFVLVSGDVYDGDWTDHSIGLFFAREVARLERAGIPLAYVRGNHDAQSVITKALTLPPSVLEFPTERAGVHRLDQLRVALHGRSFADRNVPEDFVSGYGAPLEGWFNIGLLHTSCSGYPGHQTYAPCTVAELSAKGYQYWALGHVHDFAELSREPHIVYPGNLQGRSIRECGPKGAVAVDVVDGRVAHLRHLVLDRARFAHLELDVAGARSETDILAGFDDLLAPQIAEADGRLLAIRVTLRGETSLHDALTGDPERLEAELQASAHRRHEDVWLEKVRIRTARPSRPLSGDAGGLDPVALLAELEGDPQLRERALQIVSELRLKLPGGLSPSDDGDFDLDQLLSEAEATVLNRLADRAA